MSSNSPRVIKLLRSASGSSQPWFALLEDQSEWLVKFSGAGPGPQALLAEFLANRLGRYWKFPIPDTQVVRVDSSLAKAGTDEFWDVLAASEGLNLGIRKIPEAEDVQPALSLPAATLRPLRAFDTLLVNWDRTTLSRNLMRDANGLLWWIDHGSCRFLHVKDKERRPQLPSTHFLAEVDAGEPYPLPCPPQAVVEELVAEVPERWIQSQDRERGQLASDLYDYLSSALAKG